MNVDDPLVPYGWNDFFHAAISDRDAPLTVGRVIAEHKSEYALITAQGELRAELSGKGRYLIERGDMIRPAVGDWLVVNPDAKTAVISEVLPRRTKFSRAAAGRTSAEQIVVSNVDVVLLVSSMNLDLNTKRLDRYLTLAWESGARPVVILSKADLIDDPEGVRTRIEERVSDVPVHAISSFTGHGLETLDNYFEGHRTVATLGSSGVGKSTLINRWLGYEALGTDGLRNDDKGRHATTARQLFLRPGGGLIVDTPGMRELAMWDADDGIQDAFADIHELAKSCRFSDCTHDNEPGCAVKAAVLSLQIHPERYASYLKLNKELSQRKQLRTARERTLKKRKAKTGKNARYDKKRRR